MTRASARFCAGAIALVATLAPKPLSAQAEARVRVSCSSLDEAEIARVEVRVLAELRSLEAQGLLELTCDETTVGGAWSPPGGAEVKRTLSRRADEDVAELMLWLSSLLVEVDRTHEGVVPSQSAEVPLDPFETPARTLPAPEPETSELRFVRSPALESEDERPYELWALRRLGVVRVDLGASLALRGTQFASAGGLRVGASWSPPGSGRWAWGGYASVSPLWANSPALDVDSLVTLVTVGAFVQPTDWLTIALAPQLAWVQAKNSSKSASFVTGGLETALQTRLRLGRFSFFARLAVTALVDRAEVELAGQDQTAALYPLIPHVQFLETFGIEADLFRLGGSGSPKKEP